VYTVELLNRGAVSAAWSLAPSVLRSGTSFEFEPSVGELPPGGSTSITTNLLSSVLGPFDEAFNINVLGAEAPLVLTLRGRVVGPQFALDTTALDFGCMACGFRYNSCVTTTTTPHAAL
jgi:hypothetical protein